MKTRIDFEVDGKKYYVVRPTQKQITEAELVYKTRYSEAVRQGALTNAEAMNIIQSRKIWTDEDGKTVGKLLAEIAMLGRSLEGQSLEEGLKVVEDIEDKRIEVMQINNKRNAVLDNTAESYADERRLRYYIVQCTHTEDGQPCFKDEEALINMSDTELAAEATKYIIYLVANDGQDFRADWPDYQWRIKHGLMDEEFNPIAGPIPEPEEKPKKPVRRKRAASKKS